MTNAAAIHNKFVKSLVNSILTAIARASHYKVNSIEFNTLLHSVKSDYDLLLISTSDTEFSRLEKQITDKVSSYYSQEVEGKVLTIFADCKQFWANMR
jgi:hypothetical protein